MSKKREENRMNSSVSWFGKIPSCFEPESMVFAFGPDQESYAFELLHELRGAGTTWREAKRAFRAYLEAQSRGGKHEEKQLDAIRKYYHPWLSR